MTHRERQSILKASSELKEQLQAALAREAAQLDKAKAMCAALDRTSLERDAAVFDYELAVAALSAAAEKTEAAMSRGELVTRDVAGRRALYHACAARLGLVHDCASRHAKALALQRWAYAVLGRPLDVTDEEAKRLFGGERDSSGRISRLLCCAREELRDEKARRWALFT